ncbi:MAG: hypothetical protein FWG75_01215 [Cystobacterineae bacterium]|nr:hypothetical protein [Cystobacterineae bacterium]
MKKYFVKLMLMALILTGIFPACKADVSAINNAEDSTTDNANDNTDIFSFSEEEQQKINIIKARYSSIPTSFAGGYFITVPTTIPSYAIGEVKNEVLQAGIDAINLVRYIAGIPDDVELDAEYTELNQHGAVLLTAVDELTHYPEKPEDMDPEFYQKGYKAASSSNISTVNLPPTTIFRYMDDSASNNVERVGHRRWILNPPMKKSGFGIGANRYGLMYAFDRTRGVVDYDHIAWPSPGVFPTALITNNLPWSVSINAQKYGIPDINKTEVRLKHLNSGALWTFSKNTPSSTDRLSTYYNINLGGYGINNCIIFRPQLDDSFKYEEGDIFQVIISGLDKELSYTVKMFDM